MNAALLAVDLGLRTGLALYGADARLRWYRSHNFGTRTRMRRAVHQIVADVSGLAWVFAEGDRGLGEIWRHEAERSGATLRLLSAEIWRSRLLHSRERRNGADAKRHADEIARRVIRWSGAPRPTELRHDTAEAILIGLWGVLEVGWLDDLPLELRR